MGQAPIRSLPIFKKAPSNPAPNRSTRRQPKAGASRSLTSLSSWRRLERFSSPVEHVEGPADFVAYYFEVSSRYVRVSLYTSAGQFVVSLSVFLSCLGNFANQLLGSYPDAVQRLSHLGEELEGANCRIKCRIDESHCTSEGAKFNLTKCPSSNPTSEALPAGGEPAHDG